MSSSGLGVEDIFFTDYSVCPHDCPSTCALEIEVRRDGGGIGRVRGNRENSYTSGVICTKVSRYRERLSHPDRLLYPLRRCGEKGLSCDWERLSWDDALDEVGEAFLRSESRYGSESVWPYYYAGTMGLLMRDGIHRLRHSKGYSGMYDTICTSLSWSGWVAGVGRMIGVDPREMAQSDLIVIWGTNPVNTQVNVMTHAVRARKSRGCRIACVDIYETETMRQSDVGILLRPGTDGAFACGVMHVLFRDGFADWDYLDRYTDCPRAFSDHLRDRSPEWASGITGVSVEDIESFAHLVGDLKRVYFRLGYGFTRQRNGSVNMHAVSCIPTVLGSWQYEGGGAFHTNNAIYGLDKTLIEGLDVRDSTVRTLTQTRIGSVLTGDSQALCGGPPVTSLLIQNTNPLVVCPDQNLVREGFARSDLFVCVHEQFMTETAEYADIVLPATMFLEHDDLYQSGGHQHLQLGAQLVEAPGECRSNHDVICAIASRVGASHRGFDMDARSIIDETLRVSGRGDYASLRSDRWIDCQPSFEESHFLDGFGHDDGKFHFAPDWENILSIRLQGATFCTSSGDSSGDGFEEEGLAHGKGRARRLAHYFDIVSDLSVPSMPDYWAVLEDVDDSHPFRLATSPARGFLNTSFTESSFSRDREGRPSLLVHPDDLLALGLSDGDRICIGNRRGDVILHARSFSGLRCGVVIAESLWRNIDHEGGCGINTLIGADDPLPCGGGVFHDCHVWIRKA